MSSRTVISGAGIAVLALTYWLRQFGFDPTLVEKRPDVDDEGYVIGFCSMGEDAWP